MKILVTGGAGFIGANFIRYFLNKYSDCQIVNYDKLTYAGNLDNLRDIENNKNYTFVQGDICDQDKVFSVIKKHQLDTIINFAAETHVDRSIQDPGDFIGTDVYGTFVLLLAVKELGIEKYIQISTDEVYGDMAEGEFATEKTNLKPSSPYSASKAGGDLQVLAARRTYGLPVMITRCTNNYGPYQYPEKLIPLFITNLIEGNKVPVYGKGTQIRDWLYVDDHCRAIDLVLHRGELGEIYNIGANQDPEINNLQLTETIIANFGKGKEVIDYIKDRPGHDKRYAVDCQKIKKLGWRPEINFTAGLKLTIDWYKENQAWWKKIKSGEYKKYYQNQYGKN